MHRFTDVHCALANSTAYLSIARVFFISHHFLPACTTPSSHSWFMVGHFDCICFCLSFRLRHGHKCGLKLVWFLVDRLSVWDVDTAATQTHTEIGWEKWKRGETARWSKLVLSWWMHFAYMIIWFFKHYQESWHPEFEPHVVKMQWKCIHCNFFSLWEHHLSKKSSPVL